MCWIQKLEQSYHVMGYMVGHIKKPSRHGIIGTIVAGSAKYGSCCGLIFADMRYTSKSTKIYTPRKFL